jgi:FMN-dependent NADH-azoreductase
MKQILVIESSPRGVESASRQLTRKLTERLKALYPEARLVERDLAQDPLPHLNYLTVKGIFTRDQTEAEVEALQEALRLSDQATEEVLSSDLLVIASPMWNFGLPSSLKAWVDHIVRPGKTFRYTAGGTEGLAREKKAILVLASGGIFTQGPWKSWDTEEPYLRLILSFIGITDVQIVRAQGMNIPGLSDNAIPDGERSIESLAI